MFFSRVSNQDISGISRDDFLLMADSELVKHCRVEVFTGSGPGGQHRNRNYTAVRITFLLLAGVTAEDCTHRSQKQNLDSALQKLRINLACCWRQKAPDCGEFTHRNQNNMLYALELAKLLDMLCSCNLDHKEAACRLNLSNSRLIKELAREPEVWREFQRARTQLGLFELKMPGN